MRIFSLARNCAGVLLTVLAAIQGLSEAILWLCHASSNMKFEVEKGKQRQRGLS